MELPSSLLSPSSKNNNKKTCSEKVSYIFSKKIFLCFRKGNFLVFSKKGLSYIPEMELSSLKKKKNSGRNFPSSQNKKLCFEKVSHISGN